MIVGMYRGANGTQTPNGQYHSTCVANMRLHMEFLWQAMIITGFAKTINAYGIFGCHNFLSTSDYDESNAKEYQY